MDSEPEGICSVEFKQNLSSRINTFLTFLLTDACKNVSSKKYKDYNPLDYGNNTSEYHNDLEETSSKRSFSNAFDSKSHLQ